MKLINEDRSDLSREAYANLAAMLSMVYASELIAYRMSAALDAINAKSLFQQKKQALTLARRNLKSFIVQLETAFDATFSNVCSMEAGRECDRADALHYLGNDAVRLMLIYQSRGDGDTEKRERMLKALLNFKQDDPDLDLSSMLRFYGFKLDE